MAGLDGGPGKSHQMAGILWVGPGPGQVLERQRVMAYPVEEIGRLGEKLCRT
jgi:hypothetical protein